MRLTKIGQGIIAAVVVGWLAVVGVLVAGAASTNSETSFASQGALEQTVTAIEEQGLNATAVAPADVYGEEYVAAGIICSGETTDSISQSLGVDATSLELGEEGVPADTSYLMLTTAEGDAVFDEIDPAHINLCEVPLGGQFNAFSMMPLIKAEDGSWGLLL